MLTRIRRLLRRWLTRQPTVPTLGLSVRPEPAETTTGARTPDDSGGSDPADVPVSTPRLSAQGQSSKGAQVAPAHGEEDSASPSAGIGSGSDEPSPSPAAGVVTTPSLEMPVESSSVTSGSPPSFDTEAPASERPVPDHVQTVNAPSEPTRDEPVLLTDFSAVTYPVVAAGYAPPPGVHPGGEVKPRSRWVHRRSVWRPVMTLQLLRELDERRTSVSAALGTEPVEVSWPDQEGDGESGFRVPEPDRRFFVTQSKGEAVPRTLDLALPGHSLDGDQLPDDFDRLELVRLLAITLDRLHRADVVTAGLGWDTFLFALPPRPAVLLHRPEKIRRLGGEFLAPEARDLGSDSLVSPFDADRFQLAVLAHRLLVSHEREAGIDPWTRQGIAGLSDSQVARAWRLWERSVGVAGTRPQAAEWMEVLGA